MARRLETIGLTPINNVVDASNYVLMECGQPLHTFDYQTERRKKGTVPFCCAKLGQSRIPGDYRRRRCRAKPSKPSIIRPTNFRREMCVIADAEDAVAIGGVMGGAATEVSEKTTDILVEAAEFDPVSIRNTARQLNLHSDSSYRFERQRRSGRIGLGQPAVLRTDPGTGRRRIGRRVGRRGPATAATRAGRPAFFATQADFGHRCPPERVREILLALGNVEAADNKNWASRAEKIATISAAGESITVIPPSWRRDLTREADLIEEVARIHGYEQIPEDVAVPMAPSDRTRQDRVLEKIRGVLTAAGIDEALTLSVVDEQSSAAISPWTTAEPLRSCCR